MSKETTGSKARLLFPEDWEEFIGRKAEIVGIGVDLIILDAGDGQLLTVTACLECGDHVNVHLLED